MKTFKTPAGTELPLTDLKGKDYLMVPYRVLWFRELHPDWRIETEIVYRDESYAVAKATIKDAAGNIMAQAHKDQHKSQFREFLTKAETGALGRALGFVGCGTQFCTQDFDEDVGEGDGAAQDKGFYKGVDSGIVRPMAKPVVIPEKPSLEPPRPPDGRFDWAYVLKCGQTRGWNLAMAKEFASLKFAIYPGDTVSPDQMWVLANDVWSKSYNDAIKLYRKKE